MRFGACRSQLYDAQKTARAHWDRTSDVWADAARQDFEGNVWSPLDRLVTDALRAIDQLATVFTEVRDDCEYRPPGDL